MEKSIKELLNEQFSDEEDVDEVQMILSSNLSHIL